MDTQPHQRRFSLRGFTSLLLAASFLVMCFSGVILYLAPQGRVANWTGWTMVGLEKEEWAAVHTTNSILFVLVGLLHLCLNLGVFWSYIKRKAEAGLNLKLEMAIAAVVTVIFVWGTTAQVWPFGKVADLNDRIKAHWARQMGASPGAHAEELTLAELAERIKVPLDQLVEALRQEGYSNAGPGIILAELARAKGQTPSQVFVVIRNRFPEAELGTGRGRGQGGGGGGGGMVRLYKEMRLAQFAQDVKISLPELIQALRSEGYTVEGGATTIDAVAQSKSESPRDVFTALSKHFPDVDLPRGGGGGGGGWGGGRGRR